MKSLFESTQKVLLSKDIEQKTQGTQNLKQDFEEGKLNHEKAFPVEDLVEAGYPPFLNFVAPKDLPRRRLGSALGKVALLHSLAHIEFNAINLALDAVYRFQQMPSRYYGDWLRVAADEARHFQLLQGRLIKLGIAYGEFPVHSGLWEMAENTAHDVLIRMALVPRVMEARGLDVTPGMISKLEEIKDSESAQILQLIWEEEIQHVSIGNHWFQYLCQQRNICPEITYLHLLNQYFSGRLRGPLHYEARLQAGFSESELATLEQLATSS
ncbi:MAG: hypothetical protein CL921_05935 [Deltaproteobacteria bacterium]|nr:hypothetical protein [Deltaproteobacteria bacterium]